MKNKRTKVCGIVSFIQGLFFLLISLIFGLIGIIKTQKKSLGAVLCLPSICFSILIIIFYVLIILGLQNQ